MTVPRPWSSTEQATLLAGLRAGRPPAGICRDLDRTHDDVRRRIASLLGDRRAPTGGACDADLDLLWLRVRGASVTPAPPSPAAIASLWEHATGIALSTGQREDLAQDQVVPDLAAVGRYALLATAPDVLDDTGLLDLDDWLEAATTLEVAARLVPRRPDTTRTGVGRRLLAAVVEDVAPDAPRQALKAHLRLDGTSDGAPPVPDQGARRAAVVEVARTAGVPGRPAALLRDLLLDDRTVDALVAALPEPGFAVATTVATFGGRHETEALRLAGRVVSPWRRPPNLGRGAVVRSTVN